LTYDTVSAVSSMRYALILSLQAVCTFWSTPG